MNAAPQTQHRRTPHPGSTAPVVRPRDRPSRYAPVIARNPTAGRGCAQADPPSSVLRGSHARTDRTSDTHVNTAPPIAADVLRACGRPLDAGTRAFMEPRLGHDFGAVRVHDDPAAARSAEAVHAAAYTVGRHVVFAAGRYAPGGSQGRALLAHELTHVVQQSRQGDSTDSEKRAETAAAIVSRGRSVSRGMIGAAPVGLAAQDADDEERTPDDEHGESPPLVVDWGDLTAPGRFHLIPPFAPSGLAPPASLSPIVPPLSASGDGGAEAPSRLPLVTSGRFSLGLRLGFPTPEAIEDPDAPQSALAASLEQAEFINQTLTGEVPSGWEAIDKAQLAKVAWSIFSTHLAPDVARSITSGLSTPTEPGGASYELDLVLLTDFSGGGLSFSVLY